MFILRLLCELIEVAHLLKLHLEGLNTGFVPLLVVRLLLRRLLVVDQITHGLT